MHTYDIELFYLKVVQVIQPITTSSDSPLNHFLDIYNPRSTQNIDTLESVCGVTRAIQCHGSFATATCLQCGYQGIWGVFCEMKAGFHLIRKGKAKYGCSSGILLFIVGKSGHLPIALGYSISSTCCLIERFHDLVPCDTIREQVMNQELPLCPKCEELKPGIAQALQQLIKEHQNNEGLLSSGKSFLHWQHSVLYRNILIYIWQQFYALESAPLADIAEMENFLSSQAILKPDIVVSKSPTLSWRVFKSLFHSSSMNHFPSPLIRSCMTHQRYIWIKLHLLLYCEVFTPLG